MINITWEESQEFCRRLASKTGRKVRLPTEAEWEYACRSGSTTNYGFGNSVAELSAYAWYDANAEGRPQPVGQKKANAWGLYDIHGNVWEWCGDWYGPYAAGAQTDPQGAPSGSNRVLRGGACGYGPAFCFSSMRYKMKPGSQDRRVGFRVVALEGT